jgi:Na+-transporting methylmalonyl-CoA/oxaloacetate decarboxylase gamma subunit
MDNKMKSILSKFLIIFFTAFISLNSFAVEEEKNDLPEDDLVSDVIIQVTDNEFAKKYAAEKGFVIDENKDNYLSKIINEKIYDYFENALTIFVILFAIFAVIIAVKIASQKRRGNKIKSSIIPFSIDVLIFVSSIGGTKSFIFGFVSVLAIMISASSNGLLKDVFSTADEKISNDKNETVIVPNNNTEFKSIVDIAIAEKRTLQARIVKLSNASDYKDLSVNEFAKKIKDLEKFTAEKQENIFGTTNQFTINSPVVENSWYSFGKDTQNYPAIVSKIECKDGILDEAQELNVNQKSRASLVNSLLQNNSLDPFPVYQKLYSEYKAAIESGNTNVDLKKYVPEISKAMYEDVNNITGDFESTSELVSDATFLFGVVSCKYKGVDNNNTILKIYKDINNSSHEAFNLHCSNRESLRRNQIAAFEKFTSSSKNVLDALIDSKVDQDCLTIKDGKWVLYGYTEETQSAEMKSAMIDNKAKVEAGNALFNIVNVAKSQAQNKFINNYKDIDEKISRNERLGMANALSYLDTMAELNYSFHKLKVAHNQLEISNNISSKFIVEESLFGLTEEDKNSYSENDRKVILDKFKMMNLKYLYDSDIVLNKVNTDSIMLTESSSVSYMQDLGESVFSYLVLGMDDTLKYAFGTPLELNISRGIEYCEKNDCSHIYKPTIYEIQKFGGRDLASTSFMCLVTTYSVRNANELLDVSAQATIGGKFLSILKATGGKVIKVALSAANAVGQTYEPLCLTGLVVGITAGYVAPAMQALIGIFIVIGLVASIIVLLFFSPAAPFTNLAVNIFNLGSEGYSSNITKKYLIMLFGSLLLLAFFTAIALIVISLMAYQPQDLLIALSNFGYEQSLMMYITSLIVIVIITTGLTTLFIGLLAKLLSSISNALAIHAAIDSTGDNKIIQMSVGNMIATKITGIAQSSLGTIASLIEKNNKEKDLINSNDRKLYEAAKQAFNNEKVDINDEGAKKLKELLDEMEKNKKA